MTTGEWNIVDAQVGVVTRELDKLAQLGATVQWDHTSDGLRRKLHVQAVMVLPERRDPTAAEVAHERERRGKANGELNGHIHAPNASWKP